MDLKKYYKGFDIDFDSKILQLNLTDPGSNTTLYDIWADSFSDFKGVNVCLSGGIDSQFVCSVLSKLNKDITAYIFSFVWDDSVFNSPDVIHAIRCCERFGYKYKQIEIDYKQLVESNELLDICVKYRANSPQIALQLKMLDHIDNDNPIFLGGDVPMLDYNFNLNKAKLIGLAYLPPITQPFLNYGLENKKIVIKDILRLTPESHFLSYRHFLNISIKHKLVCSSTQSGAGQTQPIRKIFYEELDTKLLVPLLKNTGFEILKMHLAKRTGIYNEYDIKYRYPLEELLKRHSWYYNKEFKLKLNEHLLDIQKQFEDFCINDPTIKCANVYNFIL